MVLTFLYHLKICDSEKTIILTAKSSYKFKKFLTLDQRFY